MGKSTCCGPSAAQEARWRAESDLETLMRAAEIKKDKKRHKAATDLARERMQATAAVAASGSGTDDD